MATKTDNTTDTTGGSTTSKTTGMNRADTFSSGEPAEWRVASLQATVIISLGFHTLVSSFFVAVVASLAPGVSSLLIVGVAVWMALGSLVMYMDGFARRNRGRCRAILSCIKDYDDPPLDEWKDSLEDRGMFCGGGEA